MGGYPDIKQCKHMIFHAILHCLASQEAKPATAGGEDGGVQLVAHPVFVAGFVGESGRKSWSFGCLWLILLG